MREFIAWKTHKGWKWRHLFWDKDCLDSKISKIGSVFKPHKGLLGRQLNAASRKSLGIQKSSIAEEPFRTKTLFK